MVSVVVLVAESWWGGIKYPLDDPRSKVERGTYVLIPILLWFQNAVPIPEPLYETIFLVSELSTELGQIQHYYQ